ncbi:hypothetical protein C8R43DRAFT_956885 [Mycena crocata]|nr:hypothetical protein C8R43DRAFT_956885 [Mycena crocata]
MSLPTATEDPVLAVLGPMLVPYRVPVTTTATVFLKNKAIFEDTTPHKRYMGYFYGAGCTEMLPVYVPVDRYAENWTTYDDLDTDVWVDAGGSVAAAIIPPPQTIGRRRRGDGALEIFSAAVAPQRSQAGVSLPGCRLWRGDILVVKHTQYSDDRCELNHLPPDWEEACFVAELLRSSNAGIGGSIATAALHWALPVLLLPAPLVSNLNIIVPYGAQEHWKLLLERVLRGVLWTSRPAWGEYKHSAHYVSTYGLAHDLGLAVTVTSSLTDSVLPVLLSSGCTSQHNLVTSTRFICPNVRLTSTARAVLGWASTVSAVTVPRMDKPFLLPPLHTYVHTATSCEDWDDRCGWSCPALKRQVCGFKGIGEFAWGGHEERFDRVGGDGWTVTPHRQERLKWRIGKTCRNTFCPRATNVVYMDHFLRLPAELRLSILHHSTDEDRDHWCYAMDTRTVVSLVCKDWQAMVEGCPSFWVLVPVTRNTKSDFLASTLQRSKSRHISVFLHCHPLEDLPRRICEWMKQSVTPGSIEQFCGDILPKLYPHIHRVSSLTVNCWVLADWHRVWSCLDSLKNMRLRTLALCVSRWKRRDLKPPFWCSSPYPSEDTISELDLRGVPCAWGSVVMISRLTVLRLGQLRAPLEIRWCSLVHFLAKAQMLEVLEFNRLEPVEMDANLPVALPIVVLPKVRRLEITYRRAQTVEAVGRIVFPGLRQLFLAVDDIPSASISHLAVRWSNLCHNVVLAGFKIPQCDAVDVDRLLTLMPSLGTIQVHPASTDFERYLLSAMLNGDFPLPGVTCVDFGSVLAENDARILLRQRGTASVAGASVSCPDASHRGSLNRLSFSDAMATCRKQWSIKAGVVVERTASEFVGRYSWMRRCRTHITYTEQHK